jgi:dihydroorotate dehydrogenase
MKDYPLPKLSPAAGWLKEAEKVAKLSTLQLSEVAVGSFGMEERFGNVGATYHWSQTEKGHWQQASASIHIWYHQKIRKRIVMGIQ